MIAVVVVAQTHTGAAVDRVGAVRTLVGRHQAVEAGAAAEDVVLAKVAEDGVVTAVALDVIVAVASRCRIVLNRAPRTHDIHRDPAEIIDGRAIALNEVIAELTEDDIVVGAACDRVISEGANCRRESVVIQLHETLARTGRIDLGFRSNERIARVVVDLLPGQRPHAWPDCRGVSQEIPIVTRNPAVTAAAVDEIAAVVAARDIVPADDIVVAVTAADAVGALAANDDVVAGV